MSYIQGPVQSGRTMTDGRDKPEFRFNSTFTLHPGENDYGSESLDECTLACVTSETLRINMSVTQHTHTLTQENKCACKYTGRPRAKCCRITSPNLVTFYRLLPVSQPPRDPRGSQPFRLTSSLSHTHVHASCFYDTRLREIVIISYT